MSERTGQPSWSELDAETTKWISEREIRRRIEGERDRALEHEEAFKGWLEAVEAERDVLREAAQTFYDWIIYMPVLQWADAQRHLDALKAALS